MKNYYVRIERDISKYSYIFWYVLTICNSKHYIKLCSYCLVGIFCKYVEIMPNYYFLTRLTNQVVLFDVEGKGPDEISIRS